MRFRWRQTSNAAGAPDIVRNEKLCDLKNSVRRNVSAVGGIMYTAARSHSATALAVIGAATTKTTLNIIQQQRANKTMINRWQSRSPPTRDIPSPPAEHPGYSQSKPSPQTLAL